MHGVLFNLEMYLYTITYYYSVCDFNYKNVDGYFLSFQWWMGLTTMT